MQADSLSVMISIVVLSSLICLIFFHQRESEFLSNRGRQGLSSILFICNG